MIWLNAKESKPKRGERVLLKIKYENNPVVGYWVDGLWGVCTDNLYVNCSYYASGDIEGNFKQSQVTHYALIGEGDL